MSNLKPWCLILIATMSGCSTGGSVPDTDDLADAPAMEIPMTGSPTVEPATIGTIYWSDGDSGRLDGMPFRLRDVDAPETGGVGAAIGGAECELERELGFLAKEFIVSLTSNAAIVITNNYGPDRFDRSVVDLQADGTDVASAGLEAGILRAWPHDDNGNSLADKPDWCVQ